MPRARSRRETSTSTRANSPASRPSTARMSVISWRAKTALPAPMKVTFGTAAIVDHAPVAARYSLRPVLTSAIRYVLLGFGVLVGFGVIILGLVGLGLTLTGPNYQNDTAVVGRCGRRGD